MNTPTLKEQVLQKQVSELQAQLTLLQRTHLQLLSTVVYYVGGELTLTKDDFEQAKGVLLTQQVEQFTGAITFRVRRVGDDGGSNDGPPLRPNPLPLRVGR